MKIREGYKIGNWSMFGYWKLVIDTIKITNNQISSSRQNKNNQITNYKQLKHLVIEYW